ncbi:NADH-quinone oxidoreductase subunit N [Hydrogenimonas urashimensis]|uniref:NADH-quinone oxidoreductase subunit N n=1 Tax=Hydrogenimonas urashimensis TaxID=2740515 RepID=UPI0019151E1C|nr:NADH-quinone oxidoreductase subunit N [Hydrogenimonas urashimensis]
MISAFSILLTSAILSPLLWRTEKMLKPSALLVTLIALLFSSKAVGLAGFAPSAAGTLFTLVLLIVLAAVILHTEEALTVTQTLFLGAAAVALLQSRSLLAFLIAFEAVSLVSVVLTSHIRTPEQAEGAVKIFVAGAVATGILMLGAFFYTLSGGRLLEPLTTTPNYYGTAGIVIMLLGLFYKLTIVPMHAWAADTYALVRSDHAALLAGAAKTAAALAAFLMFAPALKEMVSLSVPLLVTLALLTMTVGNFMALFQKRVAKILAWSSVAHAGYMLLGFAAVQSALAKTGLLYMVVAYLFMQSGVFLVLDRWRKEGKETLEEIAGFGTTHPLMALFFTVQLFSLAGIPLLAGFMGKAVLFYAGVDAGLWWAVLIALLNSALSVGYYIWVVRYLWFHETKEKKALVSEKGSVVAAQSLLLAGTLFFGIFAGVVFNAAG